MHRDGVTYETAIKWAPNLLHALQEGGTFGDLSAMKNLSEEDFFLSSGCSSSQRACSSDMQTFEADAKFSSAVLQNRNRMVNFFGQVIGSVSPKMPLCPAVTLPCAGMTAHRVVVAQTSHKTVSVIRQLPFCQL